MIQFCALAINIYAMTSILLFAAHFMGLLFLCSSQATTDQAAAAMAEGLELFAMAKAIPRLQAVAGASLKLYLHHHYLHQSSR